MGFGRIKVSRLLLGVSKVRNSLVGDICGCCGAEAGAKARRGEIPEDVVFEAAAGTSVPAKFANILGSIDLRRREPPRGMRQVSMA